MKNPKFRLLAVMLLALSLLAGCGKKSQGDTAADSASGERTDVHVGLIMGPPSMGLGYMMDQIQQGNTYNNYTMTVDGTDYSKLCASLNDGTYDIITCPSNVAAILYNNRDLQTGVKVISVSNTGILYIATTDPKVKSLEDLKGRTVYSIGEGGPPEYTFKYLLAQTGLEGEINLSFRSTPFEVLNLLQEEENAVAMLPQPFVEVAKTMVADLLVPIDLTEDWDRVRKKGNVESVTTVTVVRSDFLEQHEQAVREYLTLSRESTDFTNRNLKKAAEYTETYQTFMNPEIAEDAIPQCAICTITGKEMKEMLSGFIQIMYEMNPEAVGGAVPDDAFYYIPAEG